MPASKSLAQPIRRNVIPVGGGWRAFFAPFNTALAVSSNSTSNGPKILDLQNLGPFSTNAPPAGFFDCGWIKNFKIAPGSKIGMIRSGVRGAVRAQFRGEVAESVDFAFRESTRMNWKIATGTIPMNLLSNPTPSTAGPLSGSGAQAVPLGVSGYQAAGFGSAVGVPVIAVPAGSGSLFAAGNYIVADQDYDGVSFGLIGDAGVPIFQGTVTDVDYLRKTSDYVARVVAVIPNIVAGQDGLQLNAPIVGGGNAVSGTPNTGPTAGAKIQKVKGFAAREGTSAITDWTGLFICDTLDIAQLALYYPHLAINQFKDIAPWTLENAGTTDMVGYELQTNMNALAFDDTLDGETIVRYSAWYPPKNADIQI
jgi:hypothetical protein